MFLQRLKITKDTDDAKKEMSTLGRNEMQREREENSSKASVKLVIYEALIKKNN